MLQQPPTGRYPGPAGDLKWTTDSSSTKYTISNPASVPVSLQVHCIHMVYKNIISGGIVHVRNKYTKWHDSLYEYDIDLEVNVKVS